MEHSAYQSQHKYTSGENKKIGAEALRQQSACRCPERSSRQTLAGNF
jgi:hypothetical protein